MNAHMPRAGWICWVVVLGVAATVLAQSAATRPATSEPPAGAPGALVARVGTVTGNDVYVRSGSDQNYYAVTKLSQGQEVTIVGQKFGWLEILPPEGVFSVVDKNYVDLADAKTGVLNGRTWVQAGSLLDRRQYANQVKLGKGDRVQVLGETPDGKSYKIAPPRGAHLWINGDYVKQGPGVVRAEGPMPLEVETVEPGELELPEGPTTGPEPVIPPPSTPKVSPKKSEVPGLESSGKFQPMIDAVEVQIAAENAKPAKERVLEPIIRQLKPVADQSEDEMARLYAQARMRQLQSYIELVEAVQEMRNLHTKSISAAELLRQEREKIQAEAARPIDGIAVRGEIRVSSIYNGSGKRPLRWRIVEAGVTPARTIAYIELPEGSPIDPIQYYGRYVGIRAGTWHVLRGTAPPVPIYTVEEIQVLNRPEGAGHGGGSTAIASPAPRTVTAPSTQPASPPPDVAAPENTDK